MDLPKIEEIIVVEGRDDTAAIRQAVDAVTIETHGYGIREEIWEMIEKAYRSRGIIVFTDPDTAGEQIRRRITERFPQAKEAFLDRAKAAKAGDIGVENASPEAIREALALVRGPAREAESNEPAASQAAQPFTSADLYTSADLFRWGLDGVPGAAGRRDRLGQKLGVGHATAKTFLQRLNRFGISRDEIEAALAEIAEESEEVESTLTEAATELSENE